MLSVEAQGSVSSPKRSIANLGCVRFQTLLWHLPLGNLASLLLALLGNKE